MSDVVRSAWAGASAASDGRNDAHLVAIAKLCLQPIPVADVLVVDEHGKAWLGLDTSLKAKGYAITSPPDLLSELPLSGIRDEYLGAIREETPLEFLRSRIQEYLDQNQPGTAYEELLRTKTLTPEVMDILPASTQFTEVNITHEYT